MISTAKGAEGIEGDRRARPSDRRTSGGLHRGDPHALARPCRPHRPDGGSVPPGGGPYSWELAARASAASLGPPGWLEARMRLPTFLIIGAAKSGTSSFAAYLAQHPEVFMPHIKEPNYFALAGREASAKGPAPERVIRETIYNWSQTDWPATADCSTAPMGRRRSARSRCGVSTSPRRRGGSARRSRMPGSWRSCGFRRPTLLTLRHEPADQPGGQPRAA